METDGAEGEGKELMREVTKVRDVGRDISIGVGKIIQEPHSGHYEYYRTTFFFFYPDVVVLTRDFGWQSKRKHVPTPKKISCHCHHIGLPVFFCFFFYY